MCAVISDSEVPSSVEELGLSPLSPTKQREGFEMLKNLSGKEF